MNTLGKFLVLLNVPLSLIMLFWAVAIYFDPMDWGRKQARLAFSEPPKDKADKALPNSALPSEPAKQLGALQREVDGRPRAEVRLEKALQNRNSLELFYANYHLEYVKRLKELENSPDPIVVRELKHDQELGTLELKPGGMTVLEANGKPATDNNGRILIDSGKRIGFPMFEDEPLKGADKKPWPNKSFVTYEAELQKILKDIHDTSKRIEGEIEKEKKVTVRVNGEHDPLGKIITPGYYDLMEMEALAQRRLQQELEYIDPLWVRELYNANLFLTRHRALKSRLQELKGKKLVAE